MIPYRQENHGDFDAEWPVQRKVSGWWYITGYFSEPGKPEQLYSYQFTVIRARLYGVAPFILQLAVTDIQNGKHYFRQQVKLWDPDIYVNRDTVNYKSLARLERQEKRMLLRAKTDQFDFELELEKGKGAFWHGTDGVLVMGDPKKTVERTVYYSYPNMPTSGKLRLHTPEGGLRTLLVTGKSWFDRQWGPYHLVEAHTHWEWFSLRFFDDEEVMLFAFPQCPYYDGTYISSDRQRRNVRDYSYTVKKYVDVNGMKFSTGWDLVMPGVKEEKYEIRPLIDGQLNLAYFELLAEIINPRGERVGYCVVELLPGARNQKYSQALGANLFKKV